MRYIIDKIWTVKKIAKLLHVSIETSVIFSWLMYKALEVEL